MSEATLVGITCGSMETRKRPQAKKAITSLLPPLTHFRSPDAQLCLTRVPAQPIFYATARLVRKTALHHPGLGTAVESIGLVTCT